MEPNHKALADFMNERLSDQELLDLCFYYFFELFEEINVDAWSKRRRVREFLARAVQRKKLPHVAQALQTMLPELWTESFPDGLPQRQVLTPPTPEVTQLPAPPPFDGIEWIEIPAGEFWMGDDEGYDREKPCHRLHLDSFWIMKTPVTNAQWRTFVQDTGHETPEHWANSRIPAGKERHPVVWVNWHEAREYCHWLEAQIGWPVNLPSEAEWEKAGRGSRDKRRYPWGDEFNKYKCNTKESGIGDTTPVDKYSAGASPYGVLDMSGNVWEWTRSIARMTYPYDSGDGREDMDAKGMRGLRGGLWYADFDFARVADRDGEVPSAQSNYYGFRVTVRLSSR